MSPNLPFSAFVPESTSDGFGVLLYESQTPSWDIGAKLVAGGEREQSRRFLVTTSDGATTTEVPREEFLAAPHADDVLTISADWFLDDGTMDGYVLGTFKQLSGKALEHYQYGTLGQLEGQLIDLLFRRFKSGRYGSSRAVGNRRERLFHGGGMAQGL